MFGSDFDAPDGTVVRDYVHVTDLADAHVKALDFVNQNEGHHAFNLGTGHGASVKEAIAMAEQVTGKTISTDPQARGPGDPPFLVADASKAKGTLGWESSRSDLKRLLPTPGDIWVVYEGSILSGQLCFQNLFEPTRPIGQFMVR